jgi:hypothetical protein
MPARLSQAGRGGCKRPRRGGFTAFHAGTAASLRSMIVSSNFFRAAS